MNPKKSIFEYGNYREYLKDFYAQAKAENKNFSFRFFARIAGFKSCSVLKEVMDGKINIAPQSIDKYAHALKLNKEETFFFRHLVFFNQSKTVEEKQVHANHLMKCRCYKKLHPLSTYQFNFFNNWYFVPVRELVSVKGFKEDPEWIARHISPSITHQEAQKAVDELLKLGLLERDGGGKLRQSNSHVSTGDEVTSLAVVRYHREMLKKASESIDRHPREKRDISNVTMALTPETIKIVKEKIQKFRKELAEVIQSSQDPTTIYQLNFQFFPLSEAASEEKE